VGYDAKVLEIMISCPDDMGEERQIVREVIYGWNDVHSRPNSLVFRPVDWENLPPNLAGRPQDIINEGLLKNCDLLVGLFGSKLGTPTGKAESGSVEEIKQHQAAGKPTMVYFSSVVRASVDPAQLRALNEFREWCKSNGLVRTFNNLEDLKQKFSIHLPQILYSSPYLKVQCERSPDIIFAPTVTSKPAPSDEATILLLEGAEDKAGRVLKIEFLSGSYIQTNGKTFGKDVGPRAWARWEFALEQLVNSRLLKPVATSGGASTYIITELGYQAAAH
jgi:hypothetical protein